MSSWVVLALSLASLPAVAQKTKKADPTEAKARALYAEGQKAYDVGEFDKALASYTEAYKLKSLPGFLFNIAQCHRQLGNYKEASFFYGRFIDNSNPEAPNVELARELLEDAKRREAERLAEAARKEEEARRAAEEKAKADAPLATVLTPADVAPPPLPPLEEDKPVYTKGWFWGVVGGGVVAAAATTVLLIALNPPAKVTYPTPTLADINGRGAMP